MEAILSQLPSLSTEQLQLLGKKSLSAAKIRSYFDRIEQDDKGLLPANATSLVQDGTIQVLEVIESPPYRGFKVGRPCKTIFKEGLDIDIKIKIRGIEDPVELYYIWYDSHRLCYQSMSIKIGEQKYVLDEHRFIGGERDGYKVLKRLHEALGIPKHQTAKMIKLLFWPYGDRNGDDFYMFVKPVEPPRGKLVYISLV